MDVRNTKNIWYTKVKGADGWALAAALTGVGLVGGSAFARGLYFQQEFLYVNGLTGVLGLILVAMRGKVGRLRLNALDYAVLAMGLAYTLSIPGAADVGMAIGEALRVWTYGVYYFFLSRLLKGRLSQDIFAGGLVLAGAVVATVGLLSVPGWLHLDGSWTGVLSSTLQYHNALAAFLIAPLIFSSYYWLGAGNVFVGAGFAALQALMALALVGSQSRGGYIIFFLSMLFLVGTKAIKPRFLLLLPALNVLGAMVLWGKFLAAANAHHLSALVWIGAGVALALALEGARQLILTLAGRRRRFSRTARWMLWAILAVILACGVFLAYKHGGEVSSRIREINFQSHSVEERFVFYLNALDLFVRHPIFGYGGGGWGAAYKMVQSYLYFSTETHSILTKVLVETGLVGMVAFLGLLVALILEVRRSLLATGVRGDIEQRAFLQIAALAFLGVGLHSLIDFDLSEGAVSLLLWGILALMRTITSSSGSLGTDIQKAALVNPAANGGERGTQKQLKGAGPSPGKDESKNSKRKGRKNEREKEQKKEQEREHGKEQEKEQDRKTDRRKKKNGKSAREAARASLALRSGLAFISLVLLIFPLLMGRSAALVREGEHEMTVGQYGVALQKEHAAAGLFPWQTEIWSDSAQALLVEAEQQKNSNLAAEAVADTRRATELSRYNPIAWTIRAEVLRTAGDYKGAYEAGKKVKELAPFYSTSYELLAKMAVNDAVNTAHAGDRAAARQAAETAVRQPQDIKMKLDTLAPLFKRNWIVPQKLEVTPVLQLYVAEAQTLLGNGSGLATLRAFAGDPRLGAEARTWLVAASSKSGDMGSRSQYARGLSQQDLATVSLIEAAIGL